MSIPTSTQKLHSPTRQLQSLNPATLVTGNGSHLKCEVWLPVNSPAAPTNLVPCARPSAITPAPNSHPVRPLAHPFSPQLLSDLIGSMEHKLVSGAGARGQMRRYLIDLLTGGLFHTSVRHLLLRSAQLSIQALLRARTAHTAAKIRVAQLDNLGRLQRQQDPQTCPQTRPPLRISGSAKPL
ncbi:hypothetical protein PTTG_03117 [Puccinia triticina 1-1 BBBD Race 1]|uniref:Uncharacterized protein n=1 Tax=Puccinia triticina (isolate 1-1 / race 1 (BBBD)) TaxID=630390 RepID=A0A180GH31_PUCT1|nr:hypothetical protein PTTG_03117 [Puccinia triticina 1-1 BBBD Race 1]